MTVWSWANNAVEIRIFGKYVYAWVKHAYTCLEPTYVGSFPNLQNLIFLGPKISSFDGVSP